MNGTKISRRWFLRDLGGLGLLAFAMNLLSPELDRKSLVVVRKNPAESGVGSLPYFNLNTLKLKQGGGI